MRKLALAFVLTAATGLALTLALVRGGGPGAANASSHREAPLISEDPSADNTDLYAFVSPDKQNTFTIISNVIPGEDPAAGPNYYTFSPTARYNVHIDRNGDGKADTTFRFRFKRDIGPLFLGATAQDYTVTKVEGSKSTVVARGKTPPDNIGPRTTPNYHQLAMSRITPLAGGGLVFAGQRDDAFFADIGAIFDLVAIRKDFESGGKDFFAGYGVHALTLQLPISQFDTPNHTIGVWTSVDRPKITIRFKKIKTRARVKVRVKGKTVRKFVTVRKTKVQRRTHWVQVSRLGNPLVNEVVIPTSLKDRWNATTPDHESQFKTYYENPILAQVINQLYHVGAPEHNRDDLVSVFLTGVQGLNKTGSRLADELRLNLSIKPDPSKFSRLGVLGGDLAGYPNGRRLQDDVIDIAERAVAGALKGHNVPLGDGVNQAADVKPMATFPYEADPFSGFDNTKGGGASSSSRAARGN